MCFITTTLVSLITIGTIGTIDSIAYAKEITNETDVRKYIDIEAIGVNKQANTIAQVIDININDEQTVRVGITEDYLNNNYTNIETTAVLSVNEDNSDNNEELDIEGIVSSIDSAQEELKEEEEKARIEKAKAELANRTYAISKSQGGLLDIANPDADYIGKSISVTGQERVILERLVMGEAGNQGFEGAALVAQCIRDMYITGNYSSIDAVRKSCGYSGSLKFDPNQDVLDAVSFIFDEGGYAVKHRILYFYAPRYSKGSFHETQNLVINYKDHKFFDRRY